MFLNLICKTIQKLLKLFNRGSSLPGEIGCRFNKNFLSRFKKPAITIFVTGTVGKTTTASMITNVLRRAGYVVGSNEKGSNLSYGVASTLIENSTITGKSKVDALVIEVDERYVKRVLPFIKPDYFIIGNLSRDQLARNGHFDIVFNDINDYITDDIHLILNADNPLSYKFSLGKKNKITYFGVEKSDISVTTTGNKIDVNYCPKCSSKVLYDYFNYGNFGSYHCTSCDFARPVPKYLTSIDGNNLVIDGESFEIVNNVLYNAYNMAAVYTVTRLLKIDKKVIAEALGDLVMKENRVEHFDINGVNGTILLSKNETPISYNQSIDFVSNIKDEISLAIGFTRISGRYEEKDISWLYDVDFEKLKNNKLKEVLVFGPFAIDLAIRLEIAGIDKSIIKIEQDYSKTRDVISKCSGDVYCLFYFDLEKVLKKQIRENGDKIW